MTEKEVEKLFKKYLAKWKRLPEHDPHPIEFARWMFLSGKIEVRKIDTSPRITSTVIKSEKAFEVKED